MINELRIMTGPNIWSTKIHQLIVVKLQIPGQDYNHNELRNKLAELWPGFENDDALSDPKLDLAQTFANLALYLQNNNGAHVTYAKGELLGEASYYSIFEYELKEHGEETAEVVANIFTNLIEEKENNRLEKDLEVLQRIFNRHKPGPSSYEIMNEAKKRNIPVSSTGDGRFTLFGYGKYATRFSASVGDGTGQIAVNIAGDKDLTKQLLEDAMIPVPRGVVVRREGQLHNVLEKLGFPLVTKPLNGHHGKCITTDITQFGTLEEGFRLAQSYSPYVIIEKFIKGSDYRFLVINNKFVAAAKRLPAFVTGDGKSTIKQLIDKTNEDPARGEGHSSVLTRIEVDEITMKLLELKNLTLDSVLPENERLVLKDTANLSTGGTAVDVTDDVHPDNIRTAERVARIIGLDICGIDIMAEDISLPLNKQDGAIIEVNAAPGLRMHVAPSEGMPRRVGKAIMDMTFPEGKNGRIPIVSITGTNGKTTTSRLMAHVAQAQGMCTGLTTTEGIYIGGHQIIKGDCSGPKSSTVILQDKSVEFAVLECARGGILRSGLAFDQCDIGIVTNIAADHLGLKDIYTVEDMARVKKVVPQSVKKDGYAILNASSELVLKMKDTLECNIALFSLDENEAIAEHCKKGGLAAYRDNKGNLIIQEGDKKTMMEHVENIPITMKGKAGFQIENVLPVILSSYILKFSIHQTREALRSFYPSAEQTPGRLNVIDVGDVHVMVDYAHNPHSIKAFSELMNNMDEYKIGIITGVGDRRDEDIEEVGRLAAKIYDEIIIRIDKDTRGRDANEIIALIKKGIYNTNVSLVVTVIPDLEEALNFALDKSQAGNYVVLNADTVDETLEIVQKAQRQRELHQNY
ncbi:MAG: cyanophycin synthetase [Bacteroidetes bacterium]|nr:cyanophycin synthetase [Bacteroidota bacterium]